MPKYFFRNNSSRLHPFIIILVLTLVLAFYFFFSSLLGNKGSNSGMTPAIQETIETPPAHVAVPLKAAITGTGVNMRDAPSTRTGKVIHRFAGGERADVLDKSQPDDKGIVWYKLRFESFEGWVYGQYVKE